MVFTYRVVFNQSSNVFIAARAIVINSGLPGTVFRFASKQPGGIQSVFQDPCGWLNTTSKIYVSSSLIKSTPRIDSSWKRRNTSQLLHRLFILAQIMKQILQF